MLDRFDEFHEIMVDFINKHKGVCNPSFVLKKFGFDLGLPEDPLTNKLKNAQKSFESHCDNIFKLFEVHHQMKPVEGDLEKMERMKELVIGIDEDYKELVDVSVARDKALTR